ncbi:MAG: helix-turn-helix domain-containing protein [Clostridia bacterium]|nr:helix-turn-helix domain-containing protein [Clostridia bacterium]
MKVYTTKAVAAFLGLSERRIRQLRADGIIKEYKTGTGVYDLRDVTQNYIAFLKRGTNADTIDYNTEKARLIRAKRENEELELRSRKKELHESNDIEKLLSTMLINFKSRLMALPAKLAPVIAAKTDKAEIFKIIKAATDEALNELSDYDTVFGTKEDNNEETGK